MNFAKATFAKLIPKYCNDPIKLDNFSYSYIQALLFYIHVLEGKINFIALKLYYYGISVA